MTGPLATDDTTFMSPNARLSIIRSSFGCRHPFCPATRPGSSSNTLLITCADGPEGLALATAILSSKPLRSQLAGVVAAVGSEASEGAEKLRRLGAEVRAMLLMVTNAVEE